MITDNDGAVETGFVRRRLPWLIGAGGLLVYLLTLNHWLSPRSLESVARTAGWLWSPELGRPLTLAVFFPFRCLPDAWLPLALNLFTAVCAGLVLVQLARSVVILRHDVAPADPMRKTQPGPEVLTGPSAWLPPLLAALVCGLQPGFWEHATSASGEMPSLWCFAYALRCLLEYRLDPRPKWLSRGVLVYAAGLTDNWLMVGYLPVLVSGIIWVKSYGQCLDPRFLLRMGGCVLLGLSLYLLVPMWLSLAAPAEWDFWPALKMELSAQKQAWQIFRAPALRLLAVTALLPFVLLAVRWRSHTVQLGDDTPLGVLLSKTTGHFIHGLFFVAALWIGFNPALGPRLAPATPQLIYNYPWAIVAGYCAGYLLLFGLPCAARRPARWPAVTARLLLVLVPAALLSKNFSTVRLTNGSALREFARQLGDDLPKGRIAVLNDDPRLLLLLRAELAARGDAQRAMLIDTRSLLRPAYHRRMAEDYGSRWPGGWATKRAETTAPARLIELISRIATNEPLVYLQPSSGLFFEDFAAEPHGWIQRLVRRSPAKPSGPDASDSFATDNQQIWQHRWASSLAARAVQFENDRERVARWSRPPLKALRLASRENETAALLAVAYSKVLNHWGVQAQRLGREAGAAEWFQRALRLDPDNLAARINLEFATRRQNGESNRLTLAWARRTFPELLNKYSTWPEVLSRCGPVDEPTFLLLSGRTYLTAENPRQALAAFARSAELAPHWVAPKLWQAQSQNRLGNPAAALALTDGLPVAGTRLKGAALAQLLQLRVVALRRTGQTNEAAAYLEQFASEHQAETEVLAAAAELCARAGQWQAESKWLETLLQREPERAEWLVQKGFAELRQGEFEAARQTLTRALALAPADGRARLFRAIAALQAGHLEDARRDYEELLKQPEHSQSALFGLGGIAWRAHDTNAMIRHYQALLSNSAAMTPQTAVASQRLKEWQDE